MEIKNYGLKIDKIEPEHYVLGGGFIGTKEINPNGDWSGFLPLKEFQNINNIETYDCTGFGTNNCLEILSRFSFYFEPNFSDRFTGIVAGTGRNGNSPHIVAEAIRSNGEIEEKELPFANISTLEEFYSFKGADEQRCRNLGKIWLNSYKLQHEWVFNGGTVATKNSLMSQALKRSPIGMSVAAWGTPDKDGIYHQEWQDNHWVCCYGETDKAWKIFDSYDNTFKLYSKESNIVMAKLYWLTKLEANNKKSFLDYINAIFAYFFPAPITITPTEPKPANIPNQPIPPKTKTDISLNLFCLAIQKFEGYFPPGTKDSSGNLYPKGSRSYQNKNPGNLKSVGFALEIGKDSKGFAIFGSYEDGFSTLKNMILRGCTGKSTIYKPDMTLVEFFSKYAPTSDGNAPAVYVKFVANELKCGTDLRLKDLMV